MKCIHPSSGHGRLVYHEGDIAAFVKVTRHSNIAVVIYTIFVDDLMVVLYADTWQYKPGRVRSMQLSQRVKAEIPNLIGNALNIGAAITRARVGVWEQASAFVSEFAA